MQSPLQQCLYFSCNTNNCIRIFLKKTILLLCSKVDRLPTLIPVASSSWPFWQKLWKLTVTIFWTSILLHHSSLKLLLLCSPVSSMLFNPNDIFCCINPYFCWLQSNILHSCLFLFSWDPLFSWFAWQHEVCISPTNLAESFQFFVTSSFLWILNFVVLSGLRP